MVVEKCVGGLDAVSVTNDQLLDRRKESFKDCFGSWVCLIPARKETVQGFGL